MEHFTAAFRNFANFEGRATRTQYWMYFLFYFLLSIVVGIAEGVLGLTGLSLIMMAVFFIPHISYTTRRLHDIGRSGWWQLLCLVPIVGVIVVLVMLCMPTSDTGIEKFELQAA